MGTPTRTTTLAASEVVPRTQGAKADTAAFLWKLIILGVMALTASAIVAVGESNGGTGDRGGTPAETCHCNSTRAPFSSMNANAESRRIDGFVEWFQRNGGWVHPQLSLALVPTFGGWGLVSEWQIGPGVKILHVPSSVVLTRDRAERELLQSPLHHRTRHHPSADPLTQLLGQMSDDEVLAAYLWTESCRSSTLGGSSSGGLSFWEPYLQVLPDDVQPLLFAMDDRVRELLGDDSLQQLARDTSMRVEAMWKRLQPLLFVVARASDGGASSTPSSKTNPPSPPCDSLVGYQKFYAIVLSHGMSIDPSPFSSRTVLVPMADMINHHPIPHSSSSYNNDGFDFHKFHVLHANGSMTVTTDQSSIPVLNGRGTSSDEDGASHECAAAETSPATYLVDECRSRPISTYHMAVEQYSAIDNSLYLEKFGFVPDRNEHHCVLLSLFPENEPLGPTAETLAVGPAVCVKANGRLVMAPARSESRHEMEAMLEVLRGGAESGRRESPEVPPRAGPVEWEELEIIEQCGESLTSFADSEDCAAVWQVWRRCVKLAAADKLKSVHQRQQEQRQLIDTLSHSHALQVQIALKFVQSDIDVLQLLTMLDETRE